MPDRHQHCDRPQSVEDNWQGFFKGRWHFGLTFGAVELRHDEEEDTLPARHEPEQRLSVATPHFLELFALAAPKGVALRHPSSGKA
jgi:hypothetical protein